MSNAQRSIRGSPCSSITPPSSTTVKTPTAAIAISVVSSSPRWPGGQAAEAEARGRVQAARRRAGRTSARPGPATFSTSRTQARSSRSCSHARTLRAQLRVVAQAHEEVQREADHHDRAEREQPARDVLGQPVEGLPEDVAEHAERGRPRARADDVVGQELPQRHLRRAGDERRERAHEPDEAADQDRQPAALLEEALDLVQAVLGDLQPLAVAAAASCDRACARACRRSRRRRRPRSRRSRSARAGRSAPARRRGRRPAPRSRPARPARRTRPSRGTRACRRAGRSTCRAWCRRPRSASRCSAGRSRPCRRAPPPATASPPAPSSSLPSLRRRANRKAASATAVEQPAPLHASRTAPKSAPTGSAAIPPAASAAARARSASG